MTSVYSLELINGRHKGRTYAIEHPVFTIGRTPECELTIASTSISRQHCQLKQANDAYTIDDLQSRNGTYVNGIRVNHPTPLSHGDIIRLDKFKFRYVDLRVVDEPKTKEEDPLESSTNLIENDLSTIVESYEVRLDMAKLSETNTKQKLNAVLEMIRSLEASFDQQKLYDKILECILRLFPSSSGCGLFLSEGNIANLHKPVSCKYAEFYDSHKSMEVSSKIIEQVYRKSQGVISTEVVSQDSGAEPVSSSMTGITRTITQMYAPVMGPSRNTLGILKVQGGEGERFSSADLDVLTSISVLIGQSIEYVSFYHKQIEINKREQDLMLAKDIQLHFLPKTLPEHPHFEFASFYQAADKIGGDYFDFIKLADGRMALSVGDVSGKGVSAALLMAKFCSDVRYHLSAYPNPVEAINRLNCSMKNQILQGRFITFCICIIDETTHQAMVINAGHVCPFYYHHSDQKVIEFSNLKSGPPLGIKHDYHYEAANFSFKKHDAFLMLTDGVTECLNHKNEFYGNQRVKEVFQNNASKGATSSIEAVLEDLTQFCGGRKIKDDHCLVAWNFTS